jgi:hypothetical protein
LGIGKRAAIQKKRFWRDQHFPLKTKMVSVSPAEGRKDGNAIPKLSKNGPNNHPKMMYPTRQPCFSSEKGGKPKVDQLIDFLKHVKHL